MKSSITQCFAVLAVVQSFTAAWPVLRSPIDLVKRLPQSYSVVAVDGGSSTTAPPPPGATKTVTDAITQMQTSVIISIVKPSDALPQTVTLASTVTPATMTIQPSVTSVPFDDGSWKTTYYFRSTIVGADANAAAVATSAAPGSSSDSTAAPSPTTSLDPGQWASWSEKGNGLYVPS